MSMQIEEPQNYRIALHHLGFRPFFLLGGIFAVVAIATWFWLLSNGGLLPATTSMSIIQWHAHEMLYGYTLAVISGFLLTAVRNWTGVQTLHGMPLLLLALCWLLARTMPFIDHPQAMLWMVALDLLFNLVLCLAVLQPIVKVRQWNHLAVWSKLLLLGIGNGLFYLGVYGELTDGVRIGLYTGLYIILSLIMLMARRVIPFFIEKGVGYPVKLVNYRWLDISSLLLMLAFIIVEVFIVLPLWATVTAALLAVLHAIRLAGWYTHGIWKKPLLWSLYLGYAWLVAGFVLRAMAGWGNLNPMLAVHAFAYGTIGLVTLGMMTRVALGHTGRDVFNPPAILSVVFIMLFLGSLVRVVMPLVAPQLYTLWISASQWLWIVSFTGFVMIYAPMLVKGRIDGKYG